MIARIIGLVINILSYLPVYIYNLLYSRFYTKWTYVMMCDRLEKKMANVKRILDVGVGTGHPMKQIIKRIPQRIHVVGIDIDTNYLRYARQTFKQYDNVEIREQNFYDLENSKEQYEALIFSSSFMIMPDRIRALRIAKQRLSKGGSIFFLLTLEPYKNYKTVIIEKIKPHLKYITTIDFGSITYEKDFELMLRDEGLKIISKEKVAKYSVFLALFNMFVIEAEII
ncbi:unnamed protein product [Paramecium sonneborni]|uniref:Methyltransferase domain-containing protein n=1 Tax=Paramecium sonneborni TaxID=65129 RepID=A0A8S1NIX0_9CILI|nr:unnamed protein product [Paramecium sonneborni]